MNLSAPSIVSSDSKTSKQSVRDSSQSDMERWLPELVEIERLRAIAPSSCQVSSLVDVKWNSLTFPVYSFSFGTKDLDAPVVVFLGGVHGLERIGSRVVISALNTFLHLATWDYFTQKNLESMRVIFVPLVNPGGMYRGWRANPNGVDLMRNSPIEAEDLPGVTLLAGHRFSPKIPWFRGVLGEPMEAESSAVISYLKNEIFKSRFACTLDVHSGFGIVDRLWFPFANSRHPFPYIAEVYALKNLIDSTYPHHVYCIEPQSTQYTTHGDLWDYLYYEHKKDIASEELRLLPLCLELGSWAWIRKNPKQILSAAGIFNPILPHRNARIQRRHLVLFEFLLRATRSFDHWARDGRDRRRELQRIALSHWYGQ
jgi:hypothetical protein